MTTHLVALKAGLAGMILPLLKESTRAQHEQAEKAMNLSARLRSVETYTQLLARFYGFYAPMETNFSEVAGLDATGVELPSRRKAQRIRDDLRVCGWDSAAIESIPLCYDLPVILDIPTTLGGMYVLEGATLGGQMIRREVESHLGFTAEKGCAFFSGYGGRTREMWKSFSAAVEAYSSANPADDAMIIQSAKETFAKFEEWVARQ